MNVSLAYILAASLKELFPDTEIHQIVATPHCFFCDIQFKGTFSSSMLPIIEERMRQWIEKKLVFDVLTMTPMNAVQMLQYYGDKKLAQKIKKQEGEVTLLHLDRFFFQITDQPPLKTNDVVFCKLVCFWPLKKGLRLLGVGGASKEILKAQASLIKSFQNPQLILEKGGFVSWVGENLIWESQAETAKAAIKKKIGQLYQGFEYVTLPDLEEQEQKNLLLEWIRLRKKGGFQFRKKKLNGTPKEAWDVSLSPTDHGWGWARTEDDIKSYLHLITKFLTIFSFDYEIVRRGCLSPHSNTPSGSLPSRMEFQVRDRLGRLWTLSTLEWDRKQELVQLTLCLSFERCLALLADLDSETLLNRCKKLEN